MLSTHSSNGAELIKANDPNGVTVALISISVVLGALIVLGLLIWAFSKLVIYTSRQQAEAARRKEMKNPNGVILDAELEHDGEVIAAIALALKLHKEDLHDHESSVITINSVARAYSPWSSKIHGLTNMPR